MVEVCSEFIRAFDERMASSRAQGDPISVEWQTLNGAAIPRLHLSGSPFPVEGTSRFLCPVVGRRFSAQQTTEEFFYAHSGAGSRIATIMPSKGQNRSTQTISPPRDSESGPSKPGNAHTVTLDDSDIALLRLVGALPPEFPHDVEALQLLLDRSKAAHVDVHVVDTGGYLVHRVELANENGLPPTVGELRELLEKHFDKVADGYRDDLSVAVGTLGGLEQDFVGVGRRRSWVIPLGDGVSFDSVGAESRGFSFPEFRADRGFFGYSSRIPENFRLCVCPFPSLWRVVPPDGTKIFRFRDDTSNSEAVFFQFLAIVAKKVREASGLECILGPEVFADARGVREGETHGPWKLSFTTESAKSTFLDLCDALPRVCEMVDLNEDLMKNANGRPLRLGETLAKIAHRSTLLQRLSGPVRVAFEKNDHWLTCALTGGFELAAAESEDPEKSRKLEDADSLVDLIGTAEARPDDENASPNTIQLRIVEPMPAAHR